MAKRNRERAKQAKRKAKEGRKAQRAVEKAQRPHDALDDLGNPIELSARRDKGTGPQGTEGPETK